MADTPIPQQQGLSQEQLDSMKPIEQIYKESGDSTLINGEGVENQKTKVSNRIHKMLSKFYERLKTMDSKDEYAKEKELDILAEDLTDFVIEIIAAQNITIKTKVTTTDTLEGTATNVETGATTPMVVSGTGDGSGKSTVATAS